MPTTPRSIETFLAVVLACGDIDCLFAAFQEEIVREGYGNLVLDRMEAPADLDVFLDNASAALRHLEQNLCEPEGETPMLPGSPADWIEHMVRNAGRDRAAISRRGARDAAITLTIPTWGRRRAYDFISFVKQGVFEHTPERLAIIRLKTFAVIDRYQALRETAGDARLPTLHTTATPLTRVCDHDVRTPSALTSPRHQTCADNITDVECRALALIEIAWQRYNAGLLNLNERVADIVGTTVIDEYLARGLIEEEPDDFRFNFVFRPSRIGQRHLKVCPCVSRWRAEVWSTYVEVHERPVD